MSVLELKDEIPRLSNTERLQAMEWLWDSLRREDEALDSPTWHGDVLAARKAKIDFRRSAVLTIAQLKERLGR